MDAEAPTHRLASAAARQVNDHLVMAQGGSNVQHVHQKPFGVAVERFGSGRSLPWNRPRLHAPQLADLAEGNRIGDQPSLFLDRLAYRQYLESDSADPWKCATARGKR